MHCSVENAAVLRENHGERVKQIWTSLPEVEEKKKNVLAIRQLSGSVLSRCFLVPLGVLFVMKTLKDER